MRRLLAAFVLVVTAVAAVVVRTWAAGPADTGEPGTAVVDHVVDGDTVAVRIGGVEERVRLIGIDTPETKDPRTVVECFGRQASARTAALLPEGTAVRLVRDVEARDRYDRLLAYVYRVDDGTFVNLALVAEGYAAVATFPPNVAHTSEFVAAAASARRDGLGLWGACGGPDTPAADTGESAASRYVPPP
jgi:micrococcal nuclease